MGPKDDDTRVDRADDPANAPTWGTNRGDKVSTLAQTQAEDPSRAPAGLTEIPSIAPRLIAGGERYQLGELLGKGGMGEVVLATDDQIGRDVAIKRMRIKPSPQAYARFLREARIQGRLDHPAIVPVHELSIDGDGRPFFVMKRLTGTTLYDILDLLREGDPIALERYPRQHLLRAFADVCLAVEFAHTRGVIHRDLKPANVVLGDFGEVYVIDWGVARVLADAGEGTAGAPGDVETLEPGEPGAEGATEAGTILGTPGYIPPEQIRGDRTMDHRVDVFALGCLLFEILAGEPLLPRGRSGLTAPFGEIDARPSQRPRGRDVPPELDALCVGATRPAAAVRLASARELGAQVQRFLDGDRDLELRKTVAAEHLAAARTALASGTGEAERRAAMREAGRALALDPTMAEAADLVSRLMLEPPATMPAEVQAEMADFDDSDFRTMTKVALVAFGIYMVFLPVMLWIGVRDSRWLVAIGGTIAANAVVAVTVLRYRGRVPKFWIFAAAIGNSLLVGLFARSLSPFLIAPGLAAGTVMAFSLYPFIRTWHLISLTAAAVLVPWLLEVGGVVTRTMRADHGSLVLGLPALDATMPALEISLAIYVICLIGVTAMMGRRLSGAQRKARRALQLQAWHLRQLVPTPQA